MLPGLSSFLKTITPLCIFLAVFAASAAPNEGEGVRGDKPSSLSSLSASPSKEEARNWAPFSLATPAILLLEVAFFFAGFDLVFTRSTLPCWPSCFPASSSCSAPGDAIHQGLAGVRWRRLYRSASSSSAAADRDFTGAAGFAFFCAWVCTRARFSYRRFLAPATSTSPKSSILALVLVAAMVPAEPKGCVDGAAAAAGGGCGTE
mmetsp:Transcript_8075/g.20716  ORF Transcript_8075/g.20716 Transcript_8075/m.20716 type:complete len:205 (-) Transcript_8075:65-679(-)